VVRAIVDQATGLAELHSGTSWEERSPGLRRGTRVSGTSFILDPMPNNPDMLPTAEDPSGQCPRCHRISNFSHIIQHDLLTLVDTASGGLRGRAVEKVSALKCMGCQEQVVVIEAEINDQYGLQGVYWWPMHDIGSAGTMPGVPPEVQDAYAEGARCISVGSPNAAAAMFRTALAHVVEDQGSEAAKAEPTLFKKINQMAADGALWNDFGDAAHYIRQVGNAGAHGEAYKSIANEHAVELQQFLRELLNFTYVQPFKRRQALAPLKRTAEPQDAAAGEPGQTRE
jgi:hypothetical protein